jgi:hypothetical protein
MHVNKGYDDSGFSTLDKLNTAYTERNRLVALLSTMFPSGKKQVGVEGWDEEWCNTVYIDFPWGQGSWHYHSSDAHLFSHLKEYEGVYDGHTTVDKYKKIEDYVLQERN